MLLKTRWTKSTFKSYIIHHSASTPKILHDTSNHMDEILFAITMTEICHSCFMAYSYVKLDK
uniref:Putative ovule protein n=1 Tax=Solanum chacoense TaxID=4108 RepID=A0A0V0GT42_SOLCH